MLQPDGLNTRLLVALLQPDGPQTLVPSEHVLLYYHRRFSYAYPYNQE